MVRIEICYFCSSRIYPGHGIVFARNDSKARFFVTCKPGVYFVERLSTSRERRNPPRVDGTVALSMSHEDRRVFPLKWRDLCRADYKIPGLSAYDT